MNPRVRAVEAYLKALRTGEASAALTAARYLARLRLSAEIGGLIAASTLTFSFNDRDQIVRIEQVNQGGTPAPGTDRIPEFVKGIVNSALANNTPLIVAYTDAQGAPNLSLRGSTQVYSDTQLSIWVRHANGGMANALLFPLPLGEG
jgi:hypothetical protein